MDDINANIINLIKDPYNTLDKLSTEEIVDILTVADENFFNTNETLFSDDIYDIVKDYLRSRDSSNKYLKKVGAKIEFNKETLPYYLGSLDKIKDNDVEITKWLKKYEGEYIISEKLDGISCLLYNDGSKFNLYTRGDGFVGQNITHILRYLNVNISNVSTKIAIRGELIISRENWKKISHLGANARNIVAGAVHSKKLNLEIISNIDFIAYDMIFPRMNIGSAFEQLKYLNVPVVKHIKVDRTNLTNEYLSFILQKWRQDSFYEIDGIVVHHDYNHKLVSGQNPKYAFAFKTIFTHEQVEVIITDVEWNVSKHRYLKPLVKFNQINLGGVKIKQATGFNGAFIETNKIGPGSRVIIVRSGDVIPHILKVLTPSSNNIPKMPEVNYVWTDTKVDILLAGVEKNKQQDVQVFSHFMKTLGIEGIKEGVLSKMYDNGYDTLSKIINISIDDLKKLDGFQEKSSKKIYDELQTIRNVSCDKLLVASNIFGRGFGDKKIKLITDEYPFISYDKEKALRLTIGDITKIKGIANVTASQFISNLPEYYKFCENLGIKCNNPTSNEAKTTGTILTNSKQWAIMCDKFKDKKVIFTGFRNKDLETIIEECGGKVVTSISNSLNYVIAKDKNENNNKILKAKSMNIDILYKDDIENMLIK